MPNQVIAGKKHLDGARRNKSAMEAQVTLMMNMAIKANASIATLAAELVLASEDDIQSSTHKRKIEQILEFARMIDYLLPLCKKTLQMSRSTLKTNINPHDGELGVELFTPELVKIHAKLQLFGIDTSLPVNQILPSNMVSPPARRTSTPMNLSTPSPADVTDSSSTDSFHIDPPPGWPAPFKQYTAYQACEIIKKIENEKGRSVKAKAMQFMIDKKYLRLKSISQFYKLYSNYLSGKLVVDHEWAKVGAPSRTNRNSSNYSQII